MRNKIIAVNALVVLVVGLLSFAIVRSSLTSAAGNANLLKQQALQDATGAAAALQLDGLRAERWLASHVSDAQAKDVMGRATQDARGDAATQLCDAIASAAKGAFDRMTPAIVALVDNSGKIVGRNGSNLARGEDVGAAYPAFKEALAKGMSGTDVWAHKGRADQYVMSYVPLHDEAGAVLGELLLGMPLNDAMSRLTDAAAARDLALVAGSGDDLRVVATAGSAAGKEVAEGAGKGEVSAALASGKLAAALTADGKPYAVAPLASLGTGKSAALVALGGASLVPGLAAVSYSILGAMVLGLLLVSAAGWFLGNYISEPIAALEEGLLAILNGQSDKRFELDHAELGGLAFRIDQLLNQLMGIEEDTTDEQGRTSTPPTAAHFTDAMAVDRSSNRNVAGAGSSPSLAQEPADAYYARLFAEYIAAKKALGEPTDHITSATFRSRIEGMEEDAKAKSGKPVRYQVQTSGKEVVLLPVTLA